MDESNESQEFAIEAEAIIETETIPIEAEKPKRKRQSKANQPGWKAAQQEKPKREKKTKVAEAPIVVPVAEDAPERKKAGRPRRTTSELQTERKMRGKPLAAMPDAPEGELRVPDAVYERAKANGAALPTLQDLSHAAHQLRMEHYQQAGLI